VRRWRWASRPARERPTSCRRRPGSWKADSTIDDALAECRRRGTSGVPVASGGEMVGVVAREDMGRAIGHGLGHARCAGS
jgi:CBS domain-containing protein